MTHVSASPFTPVPGPIDRDSFLAQQLRYRRRVWQLAAGCALTVLLMGIPLSVVVSPLLWSAAVLAADVVNLATPAPDLGAAVFRMLDRVINAPGPVSVRAAATLSAALVVPGIAAIVGAWLLLRSLVGRAGTEGVLLGLGARPPRADDFEEHQLTNLVEEMAIAAGVPPPRLMMLDTDAANAGAVGPSHDQAVVIVSRGLLDSLDRDESEAVIAHVIASIGNGDLPASQLILTLALALAFITVLLGSPFSRRSRATLLAFGREALRRGDGAGQAAAHICAILSAGAKEIGTDEPEREGRARIRDILSLPFVTSQAAFWINRSVFLGLMTGPALAFMWRARRYLADATAVQLTRFPDALALALEQLARQDNRVAGAAWSAHLFVIGRGAGRNRPASETSDDPIDSILSFDPPLQKRIAHLRSAGATIDVPDGGRSLSPTALGVLLAIGVPLIALVVLVMTGAALVLVWVTLAIDMLFLLPVVGGAHALLRFGVPAWLGR